MPSVRFLPVQLVLLVLSAPLLGQALYSPDYRAGGEANYDNSLPFGYAAATQSYLQVHGDLKGKTGVFARIAFRRDGVVVAGSYAAKTITADVFFGGGVDPTGLTATFAANYLTARTTVGTNKTYSIPDWSSPPATPPAPFNLVCPLDAPYPWNGQYAFVWEMRVTAMSATHAMFADAEKTAPVGTNPFTAYGTGCFVTGSASAYRANGSLASFDATSGPVTSFAWQCSVGLTGAPTALMLGMQAADVPIPGLCANVLVLPLITFSGTAGSNGLFSIQGTEAYTPGHVGAVFFWQCACLDSARPDPIAVAMSRGATASVPPLPRRACARLYDAGSATATTGTLDPSNTFLGTVIRLD